jgi:ABC-type amino acid transport substrate-binding protein/ABC-type branched-subunit amino acid transport system substrate-binding protein
MVAFVATLATACTSGAPADPPSVEPVPVKIAFLYDGSTPDASPVITPSLYGLQLAMSQAIERGDLPVSPEVVALDTEGDDDHATELATTVADDPSFVAAVIGPFWAEPATVGDALDAAGVPTLSLSGLDTSPTTHPWSSWRRPVGRISSEATAIASALRGSSRSLGGVCLVGDGSPPSEILEARLARRLGPGLVRASLALEDGSDTGDIVGRIDRVGCGAVGWTGFGAGATELRTKLASSGDAAVLMVGSAAMKTDTFLADTEGTGDGTIVTCACVDLGTSTRPDARRFIHDFQSGFGSPPGVFAPEGWDVGGMIARAFRTGATDRAAVGAALMRSNGYEGLANSYRFDDDGELTSAAARIHLFRAEGVRWVALGETNRDEPIPVGTPGYLSVASCRKGAPFAYAATHARLGGFDVELAAAVARRLGLSLVWRDLSCATALEAVANGTLDAVLAPSADVPQGTPTSGIALSLHMALVASRPSAQGQHALLERLGPDDVVAVVPTSEGKAWARQALRGSGVPYEITRDRRAAYQAMVAGEVSAVADLEPRAWAAIERRPSLSVAQTFDAGAHDVFVGARLDATMVAPIDQALTRLIRTGRYALLFAKYFPGSQLPPETGS